MSTKSNLIGKIFKTSIYVELILISKSVRIFLSRSDYSTIIQIIAAIAGNKN